MIFEMAQNRARVKYSSFWGKKGHPDGNFMFVNWCSCLLLVVLFLECRDDEGGEADCSLNGRPESRMREREFM
jgi:hypothetical protein